MKFCASSGSRFGVVRGFGADFEASVIVELDLKRNNRDTLLIDGLRGFGKVFAAGLFSRQRRDVRVVKRGVPPLAVFALEWRAVAEEASGELPRSVSVFVAGGPSDLYNCADVFDYHAHSGSVKGTIIHKIDFARRIL